MAQIDISFESIFENFMERLRFYFLQKLEYDQPAQITQNTKGGLTRPPPRDQRAAGDLPRASQRIFEPEGLARANELGGNHHPQVPVIGDRSSTSISWKATSRNSTLSKCSNKSTRSCRPSKKESCPSSPSSLFPASKSTSSGSAIQKPTFSRRAPAISICSFSTKRTRNCLRPEVSRPG